MTSYNEATRPSSDQMADGAKGGVSLPEVAVSSSTVALKRDDDDDDATRAGVKADAEDTKKKRAKVSNFIFLDG